jgi:hypothetical protein
MAPATGERANDGSSALNKHKLVDAAETARTFAN